MPHLQVYCPEGTTLFPAPSFNYLLPYVLGKLQHKNILDTEKETKIQGTFVLFLNTVKL